MTVYSYTARGADGTLVRGRMAAQSRTAAMAALRARSLCITGIEPWPSTAAVFLAFPFSRGAARANSVPFFRSLAALVRAGVPIRRSLEITIEQCRSARFREAQHAVLSDIENGYAFSEALGRRPDEFSRLFVATIRAGEAGGTLDEVLERLAAILERERTIRKRLSSTLIYPGVVACAAIGLVFFLLVSIVPMFEEMYRQLRVPLPAATEVLIRTGDFLRSPSAWIAIALLSAGAAALFLFARSTAAGAAIAEQAVFGLPVAGAILRKAAAARFARTLGTLLRSGVNVVAALDVLGDVVGARYGDFVATLRRELSAGSAMAAPIAQSGLFDSLFVQLVRVGEETGALDAMLLRIADYYDVDLETTMASLGALLEPALIVTLGSAVGFIVSAIFIPLYTLIGNIK